MNPVLQTIIGFSLLIILYIFHRFFYDYQITPNSLKVTWFGVPVRRLRLVEIESISKRRRFRSENWANTWRGRHRILVIRKHSGFRRDFVITPTYRYEFRKRLESAIAKCI